MGHFFAIPFLKRSGVFVESIGHMDIVSRGSVMKTLNTCPGKFTKTTRVICAAALCWLWHPTYVLCQTHGDPAVTQAPAVIQTAPAAREEIVQGFTLKGAGNVRLIVKSAVSPTLQIASYTTGAEQMTFVIGCLIATGAGLVFVAPLATVPAAVGPLANTGAGAAATGVATGEAWSMDSLLGGSRARILKEVVTSVDLVASIRGALARFLRVREMSAEEAKGELEVAIMGYGFQTSREANEACSFIDIHTLLRMPDSEQQEERVLLGQGAAGDDIPPPYCTGLKRFLENDGSLARQAMIESAEIAAAVIEHRLYRRQP
jgi:hypothetical protein